MQNPALYALALSISYLLGSFPTGVVISRRRFGIDVREMGSGNIGATNITRVFGWWAGLVVFVIDFVKGAVPVWFFRSIFPDDRWLWCLAGLAAVTGHCFSIFLKLRGGKGVASSLGVLLVLEPWIALVSGVVYGAVLIFARISALGSLAALAVAVPLVFYVHPYRPEAAAMIGMGVIVLVRHIPNIRRLFQTVKVQKKRCRNENICLRFFWTLFSSPNRFWQTPWNGSRLDD